VLVWWDTLQGSDHLFGSQGNSLRQSRSGYAFSDKLAIGNQRCTRGYIEGDCFEYVLFDFETELSRASISIVGNSSDDGQQRPPVSPKPSYQVIKSRDLT